MPQFELANFLPQMAWLLVAFTILYFVIVRSTLPRLGRVVTARDAKIAGDIEAARAAKDAADEIDLRYQRELGAARDNARQAIAEAKAAGNKASEARLATAQAAADAEIAAAEQRIAAAADAAGEQLREVAAESAQQIVARLTGLDLPRDAARARVDAAMDA